VVILAALTLASSGLTVWTASAQEPQQPPPPGAAEPVQEPAQAADRTSPWLALPVVASNPKLGTAFGGVGAYLHEFDPESRMSIFGVTVQYTTSDSIIAAALARTSFGADHHRVVAIGVFGNIKNDYEDYLGTGQPLQTNDDLKAVAGRYLYRVKGPWLLGAQGNAANYQVFGVSAEDDLILETLGVQGFQSAGLGAVIVRDSRDNEDMPTRGWYLNLNNLAYREALGGVDSFDMYRADLRVFWPHGGRHVLAFRQLNWLSYGAPAAAQATVVLRAYKIGQYLAPYMSSLEAEERWSFNRRWGATVFGGVAVLYGEGEVVSAERTYYPMWGAGLHFIVKPDKHMLANLEYAQGVEDNYGFYLKFGYAW
jgi:hypothetical protein